MLCFSPLPTLVVSPGLAPVSQHLSCLETPKLDIVRLLVQSLVGQIEENEYFSGAADYVVAHVAQDVSDPLLCKDTLLVRVQLVIHQEPAIFASKLLSIWLALHLGCCMVPISLK